MMKAFAIRKAVKGDVKRLIELCEIHAKFEKASYNKYGKEQKLSMSLFCENPSLFCFVAVMNQEVIGYATYMKQFSTWDAIYYIYMDCLFLTSESRGLGMGEELMERIKEEGRKEGCTLLQWQTPDFNKRAMKFYDRMGAKSKSKERYFLKI